jgi:hypothetical protein
VNSKSVFEVVSGNQKNGKLQDIKHAGVSSLREDNGFYKLTLNMWPGMDYFISKNQSNSNYTIFSKIVRNGADTKFQNPVGYAKILSSLRTHLLLRFEVPNLSLYMSLFPSQ